MKIKNTLLLISAVQITLLTAAQSVGYNIRLKQVGCLPNAITYTVAMNTQSDSFSIMKYDLRANVFEGQFLPPAYYPSYGEDVSIADFKLLNVPGDYVFMVDDLSKSVLF